MRKCLVLLMALFLLFPVTAHLLAQEEGDIPECSNDEINDILEQTGLEDVDSLLQGVIDSNETVLGLSDSELIGLLESVEEYRIHWWTEIVPSLPRCQLALDLSISLGRDIEEIWIAIVLIQAGHDDLAKPHLEQRIAFIQEVINLIQQALDGSEAITTVELTPTSSTPGSTQEATEVLSQEIIPMSGEWSSASINAGGNFIIIQFTVSQDGSLIINPSLTRVGVVTTVTSETTIRDLRFSFTLSDYYDYNNLARGSFPVSVVGTFVSSSRVEGRVTYLNQTYNWTGMPK